VIPRSLYRSIIAVEPILGKLKELPVDATKHLVLKLLGLGLSRTPDV